MKRSQVERVFRERLADAAVALCEAARCANLLGCWETDGRQLDQTANELLGLLLDCQVSSGLEAARPRKARAA